MNDTKDSPPIYCVMSKEDILKHFNKYDFRDTLGHPLCNCVDFLYLLECLTYYKTME